VLYLNDELSGLFGSMDAYRARAGKDRPFWLQAKEGGPYTVNRKTSGRIVIESCAISVLGGIQPDKIKRLMDDLSSDGMLQRFLPVILRRTGYGEDLAPNREVDAAVYKLAERLAGMPPTGLYRFVPAAASELQVIEAFKARECERLTGPISEWLNKMPNEFGRWSLIFHAIECCAVGKEPPDLISLKTARRVRRFLIEFAFPHARAFYAGTIAIDQHAKWVAELMLARKLDVVRPRDIYRNYRALKNKRDLIPVVMQNLINAGWVRMTRAFAWQVNPLVHDGRFKAIAEAEAQRRADVREEIREQVQREA
jgi:Protein of unknown function (DUF3987)